MMWDQRASERTRVSKQNDFTWKLSLFWNYGECKESLDMYRRIENQHSLRMWTLLVTYHCYWRHGARCAAAWRRWLARQWVPPPSSCWTWPPGQRTRTSSFYLFLTWTHGTRCRGLRTEWSDHWGPWQSQGTRNKKCNKRLCVVWRILSRLTQPDCL